jgi:hypothetical protein
MFPCSFWEKTWSDPAIFWAAATAIATVILVGVAWIQLRNLADTSRSDFCFRLKNDFFTECARQLFFLLDYDLLKFEDGEIPYFTIRKVDDPALRERFKELGIKDSTVSTYVVDDILLGPLEDVALFLAEKLITETHAYELFYTYVASCAENTAIQEYIRTIRLEPKDLDIYSKFDNLYKRLHARATRN